MIMSLLTLSLLGSFVLLSCMLICSQLYRLSSLLPPSPSSSQVYVSNQHLAW